MPTTPASIKRRPIHPMLIAFPIGLWVFSLICDIVFLAVGTAAWRTVALWSMGGGIIGGLLPAIPRFIDWTSIHDEPTGRIATIQMVLNLCVVVLYVINWALRFHGPPVAPGPFVLSIIGILVLCISEWLGGTLVYEHRVAVSEDISGAVTEQPQRLRKAA